jgi:hypothetical protein
MLSHRRNLNSHFLPRRTVALCAPIELQVESRSFEVEDLSLASSFRPQVCRLCTYVELVTAPPTPSSLGPFVM